MLIEKGGIDLSFDHQVTQMPNRLVISLIRMGYNPVDDFWSDVYLCLVDEVVHILSILSDE